MLHCDMIKRKKKSAKERNEIVLEYERRRQRKLRSRVAIDEKNIVIRI